MQNDLAKYLYDILEAAKAIRAFVEGKEIQDYQSDEFLRSAVERKFEIIGEALNRIKKEDPNVLESIREHRSIISFRNILIHGYNGIDDNIVWSVIQDDLNNLIEDVEKLLSKIK